MVGQKGGDADVLGTFLSPSLVNGSSAKGDDPELSDRNGSRERGVCEVRALTG